MKIHEDTWKIAERRRGKFWDQTMNAGSCWEAQGGGHYGEFRYWDLLKVLTETGEHADIEARWPQKIGEREGGAGENRILKQHKRKKLWRGLRGETYKRNQMDAGSWEAHWGKRKLDIKTRWRNKLLRDEGWSLGHWTHMTIMQEVVERRGGKPYYWNQMHSRKCEEATGDEIKWIQEVAEGIQGGSLDIETRWMQEETRWTQEVCGEARAGGSIDIQTLWEQRYWTQMTMHGRSCGETRGRSRFWEAQVCESFRILKQDACKKLRGGHGGATYETKWMQEVVEGHWGGEV